MKDSEERAKWVERAKKLLAMAEGAKAVGNEAEAESFMEGLQKLLHQQKLDWVDIELEIQDEIDPLTAEWHSFKEEAIGRKRRRQGWVEALASAVCVAHFCNLIVSTGSNSIMFVGRTSDVQCARYMINMLVRIGKEGADKAYRKARYHKWKANKMAEAHGFRAAFLLGYTERLGERLREMHRQEIDSDQRMALVLVRSRDEIAKYQKDNIETSKARSVSMEGDHEEGLGAGRAAANEVNLNTRGVKGGKTSGEKALDRQPKQLGRGQ